MSVTYDSNIAGAGSASGDITAVTAGTGLSGGGTGGAVTVTLSSPVALTNGGTGTAAASANAAFNALSPMTTGGDVIYGGASGAATRLINGTAGQVLTSAGTTLAPTWTTVTSGLSNPLANDVYLNARNNGNTADLPLIKMNANNAAIFGAESDNAIHLDTQNDTASIYAGGGTGGLNVFTASIALFSSGSNTSTSLQFLDADNSHYIGLKAPNTTTGDSVFSLPDGYGNAGQALTNDGGGAMGWEDVVLPDNVKVSATITAGGTTGNQTINKVSGTVNFATAATTLTVTNSLVTTSSIIFAVVRTDDATATIKNVVPGTGSFVIKLTAGAGAETSVGFFVVNQ